MAGRGRSYRPPTTVRAALCVLTLGLASSSAEAAPPGETSPSGASPSARSPARDGSGLQFSFGFDVGAIYPDADAIGMLCDYRHCGLSPLIGPRGGVAWKWRELAIGVELNLAVANQVDAGMTRLGAYATGAWAPWRRVLLEAGLGVTKLQGDPSGFDPGSSDPNPRRTSGRTSPALRVGVSYAFAGDNRAPLSMAVSAGLTATLYQVGSGSLFLDYHYEAGEHGYEPVTIDRTVFFGTVGLTVRSRLF